MIRVDEGGARLPMLIYKVCAKSRKILVKFLGIQKTYFEIKMGD